MDRITTSGRRARGLVVSAGLLAVALAAAPGTAFAAGAPDPAPASASTSAAVREAGDLARLDAPGERRPQLTASPVAASAVAGSSLERGQTLASGDALQSPNGRFQLSMEKDGELLLVKAPNRLNSEPYVITGLAFGDPGSRLVLQTDGNLVLYGVDGTVFEDFGTAGSAAQSLVVQDDGNVVLYSSSGVVLNFDTAQQEALFAGGTLLPGEQLVSGGTTLVMQSDGNLVLYQNGARFQTGTFVAGSAAVVQDDGNVVVYSPSGQPLYQTGSRSDFAVLVVSDGEFRVFDLAGDAVTSLFGTAWGTDVVLPGADLLPGDRRTSANGNLLILQEDGNLVEYANGRPVFQTGTAADFGVMQPDGNFVLYQFTSGDSDQVRPVFQTFTGGNPGSRLVVQRDTNLVVYTQAGRAVYSRFR